MLYSARILEKRGIKIHHSTISRWINNNQQLIQSYTRQNDTIRERIATTFLDASDQILFMNREAKTIYDQAIKEGDRLNALRALDQMGKNLLLYQKVIGLPDTDKTPVVKLIQQLPSPYREVLIDIHNKRSG